jgi:hypothetical protein
MQLLSTLLAKKLTLEENWQGRRRLTLPIDEAASQL